MQTTFLKKNQDRVQARRLDSLVILQSSPTFGKYAIQNQKPKSRAHLDTISVEWGEEDELVLPIVARIPDDVVQRDPVGDCQEILRDFLLLVSPPIDGVHEDIKLVEDSERRSHRVPEGQD